jgi:hypothetical protein
MLAYGTIYDQNGHIKAEGVMFTAFISTASYHFVTGNNTWNQSSYSMVWGDSGAPDDISGPTQYISMSTGYVLHINHLYSYGQTVSTYDAKMSTWNFVTPESPITITAPPQASSTNDSNNFLMAILLIGILAAILIVIVAVILVRKRTPKMKNSVCPQCGKPNDGSMFCGNCGRKLN